jgi:hypothetical protein
MNHRHWRNDPGLTLSIDGRSPRRRMSWTVAANALSSSFGNWSSTQPARTEPSRLISRMAATISSGSLRRMPSRISSFPRCICSVAQAAKAGQSRPMTIERRITPAYIRCVPSRTLPSLPDATPRATSPEATRISPTSCRTAVSVARARSCSFVLARTHRATRTATKVLTTDPIKPSKMIRFQPVGLQSGCHAWSHPSSHTVQFTAGGYP